MFDLKVIDCDIRFRILLMYFLTMKTLLTTYIIDFAQDFCLVPRDPVNQVTQATWVTLDNRVNEDPNNLTTGEPVETVEINEVPTPDCKHNN